MMHLDYVQFSIPLAQPMVDEIAALGVERQALSSVLEAKFASRLDPATMDVLASLDSQKAVRGLPPYDTAIALGSRSERLANLMTVMYNSKSRKVDTMLVQFSGAGCAWLDRHGVLASIVHAFLDRIGRVDFAFDFETDIQPENAFASETRSSIMRSNTGTTVYCGSVKSTRYFRCYRYFEPHPRAAWLRFEFVFKDKRTARPALEAWLYKQPTFDSICQSFRVRPHESFERIAGDALDPVPRNPTSSDASTTLWLIEAAAPAFRRLCASGAIEEPELFLAKYFLEV